MSGKRGIRARLLLASGIAVAIALTVLVASFNLVLRHELSSAANDRARSRATAELAAISVRNGSLQVTEAPDAAAVDVPVWIFSGATPVESPRVGEQLDRAAAALASTDTGTGIVGETRLDAVPVVYHGNRLGTVVAAVSLVAYDDTARTALIGSLLLALAVLVVSLLVARWLLGKALAPVAEMTSAAAIWSEHDLDRRFAAGQPLDELGQLAAALDGLLDRITDALRREQLFTAEISHELRTPLARIVAETDLALRRRRDAAAYRRALETVGRNATQLTLIVNTLLEAARTASGQRHGSADALAVARRAAAGCRQLASERGVELEVFGTAGRIAIDADLAERILQPLIENACRHGHTTAVVEVARDGATVTFLVTDDGTGVPESQRASIFEPGVRGDHARGGSGVGLGLTLARR
ncbi:MAG: HAMP domain-containing sensor histidine kinase, partial [Gaiellales bacterium]